MWQLILHVTINIICDNLYYMWQLILYVTACWILGRETAIDNMTHHNTCPNLLALEYFRHCLNEIYFIFHLTLSSFYKFSNPFLSLPVSFHSFPLLSTLSNIFMSFMYYFVNSCWFLYKNDINKSSAYMTLSLLSLIAIAYFNTKSRVCLHQKSPNFVQWRSEIEIKGRIIILFG